MDADTTMNDDSTRGLVKLLGFEFGEVTQDRVTIAWTITPDHFQPYGIVHGGVWASIVETVASHGGALAANDMGMAGVVGTSNLTDFLRSHKEGRVDAVGTPVFVGRTQQLWSVEITRPSDGKLVARGQVRLQNLTVLPQDR